MRIGLGEEIVAADRVGFLFVTSIAGERNHQSLGAAGQLIENVELNRAEVGETIDDNQTQPGEQLALRIVGQDISCVGKPAFEVAEVMGGKKSSVFGVQIREFHLLGIVTRRGVADVTEFLEIGRANSAALEFVEMIAEQLNEGCATGGCVQDCELPVVASVVDDFAQQRASQYGRQFALKLASRGEDSLGQDVKCGCARFEAGVHAIREQVMADIGGRACVGGDPHRLADSSGGGGRL